MRQRTGRIAGAEQPAKGDAGFTLIEVIMTITLMAMVIIPIIDATFTSIRASATSREVSEVETVLQNAADRVNRAPTLCTYDVYVQAAVLAKGWVSSQATATYQYYEPGASARAADPGTWKPGACPNGVRTPRLIQMVTITVSSESGTFNRSIQVVKSDV